MFDYVTLFGKAHGRDNEPSLRSIAVHNFAKASAARQLPPKLPIGARCTAICSIALDIGITGQSGWALHASL
jgi:hypothetical protein